MRTLTKKHLRAVEKLIVRYNGITIQELKTTYEKIKTSSTEMFQILTILTGYGNTNFCILCSSCKGCLQCIHSHAETKYKKHKSFQCANGKARKSYYTIEKAKTFRQLYNRIKARAKYLQSLLDDYNKKKGII